MVEFIWGFVALAIFVVVWTTTGHLIWLFFAFCFRALAGTTCPECGSVYRGDHCSRCSVQSKSSALNQGATKPAANVQDDLAAAHRLIAYSKFNRWLDDEQQAELDRLANRLSARISGKALFERAWSAEMNSAIEQAKTTHKSPAISPHETRAAQTTPIVAEIVPPEETHAQKRIQPTQSPDSLERVRASVPSSPVSTANLHPLDQTDERRVDTPKRAPVRQRLTADLLKSFMEQSNIRWIELISAALIVVCSVGLVISLWSTLSSTSRFFPSLVFLLATVAVHGAGQYTLRQWKLRTTSRGILHIGLMLIPLAMLVGILLSKRDGQLPSLDLVTGGAIAIGTAVYGGLAITASRSLFARRWPVVAVQTIASSLTLIPIYYLSQRGWLTRASATWALVPMIVATLYAAFNTSQWSIRTTNLTRLSVKATRFRLIAGAVTQSLFCVLIVVIFWTVQSKQIGSLDNWWFVATGIISAGWISWGWSASLAPTKPLTGERHGDAFGGASWMMVAGWTIATVFTLFLLTAVWQVAFTRVALVALLSSAAAWWLLHGGKFNLRISLQAGAIAAVVASSLTIEGCHLQSAQLQAIDWLCFERIFVLTAIGLATTIATSVLQLRSKQTESSETNRVGLTPSATGSSPRVLLKHFQVAGGITVAAAALLTLVASFVPLGPTPWGGNWAALMLISYGVAIMAVGIFLTRHIYATLPTPHPTLHADDLQPEADSWGSRALERLLLPIGQLILLFGTVRLCQTSPILESWLGDLRPISAWAIGTLLLALVWSLLAALIRGLDTADRQRSNIDMLCGFSVLLSLPTALAIWLQRDQLALASTWGWFLPIGSFAIFIAWRNSVWRELTLFGLCLWLGSALYATGDANAWWTTMGLGPSCAAFVLGMVGIVAAFEFAVQVGHQRLLAKSKEPEGATSWFVSQRHFASHSLCYIGWIVLCVGLTGPAALHTLGSLKANLGSVPNSFVGQSLSGFGFVLVLASIAALSAASFGIGRIQKQSSLLGSLCVAPLALALAVTAFVAPPYSVAAALWTLALVLISSECLQFASAKLQAASKSTWQQLVTPSEQSSHDHSWLLLGRLFAIATVFLGTMASAIAILSNDLPSVLAPMSDSWLDNVGALLILLGPAALTSLVRWSISLWNSESPRMVTVSALSSALVCSTLSALALVANPPWHATTLVLLQSFALVVAVLAWTALGFAWLRNFIRLRSTVGRQSAVPTLFSKSTLFTKSMKGLRWQRCETAAWSLSRIAMGVVALLCVISAIQVVTYPIFQLPGIGRLGSLAMIVTSVISLGLVWFLSIRGGASRFGLLAFSLGLVAPLGAAAYTAWLAADISRNTLSADGFEPIRALLSLWLVSLAIGLIVRFEAMRRGKAIRQVGELAWVLLATIVAAIAIVCTTQDPSFYWPMLELNTLAIITVFSGVLSRQPWRGHLAAVASAIGLSAWMIHGGPGIDGLSALWIVLWGPTCIATTALIAERLKNRWQRPQFDSHVADELQERGRFAWLTVDTTVILSVPVVTWLCSAVWIQLQLPIVSGPTRLTWWILGLSVAVLMLAMARLWKHQPSKRGLGVYLSLIAFSSVLAMSLCSLGELPKLQTWLIWLASTLAALAAMAGLLRELARESSLLGPKLRLGTVASRAKFQHALGWMPAVHSLVGLAALLPSILLVLALEDRSLRIAATMLPFLGGLAVLPIASGRGRAVFRYLGIGFVSISTVLLWWADLPNAWAVANVTGSWIFVQRTFVGLVALGIGYPVLARVFAKKVGWAQPLTHIGWVAFFFGVAAGGAMVLGEFAREWEQVAATASLGTKLTTLVAWVAVIARLLQFAVRPHSTDATASHGLRKSAVLAAEGGIALLCAATYFHFPDLFRGILVDWWPIVMFAIAMFSAGLGEWLRRVKQPIIGDPIRQSSMLLPIIPLAGVWWIEPESAQWLWNDWGRYAILLLSGSALYALHGWLRDSVALRALAGWLGLLAFWSFLQSHPNLGFLQHPQFWLLPPAVAALAFVELNRRRLDNAVVTATRYIAVLIAYLSSSSEVFLNAFEGQLWQPIVLLALALAGVAAGIILRVRAFLFCGAAFTFVALLGMVWHAQQAIGQVWPWWAFGIVTGICLIVFLGYFEKNRPRVITYLDNFKQWEK